MIYMNWIKGVISHSKITVAYIHLWHTIFQSVAYIHLWHTIFQWIDVIILLGVHSHNEGVFPKYSICPTLSETFSFLECLTLNDTFFKIETPLSLLFLTLIYPLST